MHSVSDTMVEDGVGVRVGDHVLLVVSSRLTAPQRRQVAADLERLLRLSGGDSAGAVLPAGAAAQWSPSVGVPGPPPIHLREWSR
ncbi:MAG: hypothetical protein GEV09_02015 [Pseudonocardiaceae bacterium]|nr:hypothetical protein [Pseudonocardiaceae bacterium]